MATKQLLMRFGAVPMALLVGIALSGCSITPPLESASPHPVPAADALLVPSPGAGAILSVVETGYINATEQTISFDTHSRVPGQNYAKIQLFSTNAHSSTPGGLQDVPLGNLDMAGEARGLVSYADMKLSPYFVQNTYGPFGYSMGRTATADLCMYAWQRVAADFNPGGGVRRGAVNLRLLICDDRKTEQDLVGIMLQLRIKGVTGQARRASAVIGAYGTPVSPFGANGIGNVLPVVAPVTTARRAAAPVAEPIAIIVEPAGPVPAPNGSTGPSTIAVPAPNSTSGAVAVPAPASSGTSSGSAIPLVPPPQ